MAASDSLDQLSPAKRAVYEIRTLKNRVAELESMRNEPVAIIGVGLRFPAGASDPESFWRLLDEGVDAINEIPSSRWPIHEFYDADGGAPGKMYARHGAFLDDPTGFDADFFNISPLEAESLDPQHRLALEVAWESLENAAQNPHRLDGTDAGVFLAMSNSDYGRLIFSDLEKIDAYSSTGNLFSTAAGRISYSLGFRGPSFVLDTACSGSLVAIHLACQSLRGRECSLALAGGVNLILTPEIHINFSKSRMMARDGRCKTFDAAADGYVRGEGCAMVVLKRLSEALSDGDRILAIIRGSAVNQDGRSSGITAPNGAAQEALLRQALASASLAPNEIDYIELHGTGTALGDPIEANALGSVFGPGRLPVHPLKLGSVKTNIGHLEAASGIAGLIKTVLAFEHERIPRSLHFNTLNPQIDWRGAPLEVAGEAQPWPRGERRRIAGVSSFGFSGTNAHIILEEPPVRQRQNGDVERPVSILAASAQSHSALDRLLASYRENLNRNVANLPDICFTANSGRAQLRHRAVMIGTDKGRIASAEPLRGVKEETPDVVFLFPGQGAQYPEMGHELYETHPVFRQAVDECANVLGGMLEEPLLEVLWGRAQHLLDQTAFTQPALFAIEYALSRLWQSWGVRPTAVLGHSAGEFAAAFVAGACGLEDALKLIATRARLMQSVPGRGAMLSAAASEQHVRRTLSGFEDRVSVAALNAPQSVVVSGYESELAQIEQRLRSSGVRTSRLAVSHAYHSPQMKHIEPALAEAAAQVRWTTPRIQLLSTLTGNVIGPSDLGPHYWRRELLEPVRFQAAIGALRSHRVFLEIGPGSTLAALGKQCIGADGCLWATSLRLGRSEWTQMLESLGGLYVRGVDVDWPGFDSPYRRSRVALPTYPFEHRPYLAERSRALVSRATDAETEWQAIQESVGRQAEQCRLDLKVELYRERWTCLNKLALAYIIAALRGLGVFLEPQERHSAKSMVSQNLVRPDFEKLLQRWLKKLSDEGILQSDGPTFCGPQPLPPVDPATQLAAAGDLFLGDDIFLEWVSACGGSLKDILCGRGSPLETLFPGGSFVRAEALYEHAPLSAYFASLARAALEGLVRSRPAGKINVLEIGAGTGATTSALLPVLPPDRTTYFFTDVSDLFLNRAARKFQRFPFMRFARLDIEKEDTAFPPGIADVLVATNVLHATADIRRTVERVQSLLASDGYLILSETTEYFPWYDVTTGLIEGWQRFDDGLRGDHPLLDVGAWTRLLEEFGFTRIAAFPRADSPARILGQHVIVARAPSRGKSGTTPRAIDPLGFHAEASPKGIAAPAAIALDGPPEQRHEALVELVRGHIAQMLRFDSPERIERKRRLLELGLDSLMALDLRNRLASSLQIETPLSATIVFDYPTLDEMAAYLENDVLHLGEQNGPSPEPDAARVQELNRMSEEEAEAILMRKLQSL